MIANYYAKIIVFVKLIE